MPLQNLAAAMIADAIIGGGDYDPLDNAHAHIGVGNGTDAHDTAQTDLTGASKARKPMDAGYPTRDGATVTFQATFGTADANFAWEEWGLFNAASGGQMYSRKVEDLGTKTSSATWQLQVEITHSV